MRRKDYNKYAKVALSIALGILVLSFISSVVIVYIESPLEPYFGSEGFSEFFRLFNAPLTMLAASFAVFATWLTLERIAQTERQLYLIGENNRFNNYYRHLEEFSRQFEGHSLLNRWKSITRGDPKTLVNQLYRDFYYKHPQRFSPNMNDTARELVSRFFLQLDRSLLNNSKFDFHSPWEQDFSHDLKPIGTVLTNIINRILPFDVSKLENLFDMKRTNQDIRKQLHQKFAQLHSIYWCYQFYQALLIYDGLDPQTYAQLVKHYNSARKGDFLSQQVAPP